MPGFGAARGEGQECRACRTGGASREGWENGQVNMKRAEPVVAGSALAVGLVDGYAAAFFAVFGCGLGTAFFTALAFSFAANSCLTFAVMSSMSTL